jgi:anti-anti-sigma regulatory factor
MAGWRSIEIDMGEVTFIDGGGIAVIERHVLASRASGGSWVVVNASAAVRRLIGIVEAGWLADPSRC